LLLKRYARCGLLLADLAIFCLRFVGSILGTIELALSVRLRFPCSCVTVVGSRMFLSEALHVVMKERARSALL
jgi:hypothetical protein